MPDPSTSDPAILDDPRPTFEGDWATASGVEKGEHSERVRLWKERHGMSGRKRATRRGAEAQSRIAAGDGRVAPHEEDIATLDAIIHGAPLPSDRIRAIDSKQRILAREEAAQREEAYGPLVALGAALRALPEAQRVDALSTLLAVTPAPQGEALSE